MADFLPLLQHGHVTGAGGLGTTSFTPAALTVGSSLAIYFGAYRASIYVSPTIPTSVADNNGNVYNIKSETYSGVPGRCTTAIFEGHNLILTPHNPPTITVSGFTNYASGSPSIIWAEVNPTTNWQLFSFNNISQENPNQSSITFFACQLAGNTTSPTTVSLAPAMSGQSVQGATVAIMYINQFLDLLLIYGDYAAEYTVSSWNTTGTVIDYTNESGTNSGVLCYYSYNLTSGCGTLSLSISCNTLPNGCVGQSYNQQIAAPTGGVPPYTYTLLSGSIPGLTLNSSTGYFTGTPTTAGAYLLQIEVTDSDEDIASVYCAVAICICGAGGGNYAYYSRH